MQVDVHINGVIKTNSIECDNIGSANINFSSQQWWDRFHSDRDKNKTVLFEINRPPGFEASWKNEGYTVQPFLTPEENIAIKEAVEIGIKSELKTLGVNTDGFTLEKYHNFVSDNIHYAFIDKIRAGTNGQGGLPCHYLTVPIECIDKRISQICNTPMTAIKSFVTKENRIITTNHFWLRIIRPGRFTDNNPPHKDIHIPRVLENEDYLQVVNLYYPLAGSNEHSSLPIIPGSHLWPEEDIEITHGKFTCNGVEYTNPAVVRTKYGLKLITPNPKQNEVMVFTPYAIHGGGFNFNTDVTRVSLEMRFWRL